MSHVFIRTSLLTHIAVLALLVLWSPYAFGSQERTAPQLIAVYFATICMLDLVSEVTKAETPEKALKAITPHWDWIAWVSLMYWGGFWL